MELQKRRTENSYFLQKKKRTANSYDIIKHNYKLQLEVFVKQLSLFSIKPSSLSNRKQLSSILEIRASN
jgi:hypothetical protein